MRPIRQAIKAMTATHVAFSQHGLLSTGECAVCRRLLEGGVHTGDCPVDGLRLATLRLQELQQQLAE